MKKIGITTFFKAHNYGAVLQVYALQKSLLKYDVEILNYDDRKLYRQYQIFSKFSKNIFRYAGRLLRDLIYFNRKKRRYVNFEGFINNNLNLSENCHNLNEINILSNKYDVLITGSDQVWNYNITNGISDVYTLNFGKKKVKRIAYAASVGNKKYLKEKKDEYGEKLKILNNISVREEDVVEPLKKMLNKKVDFVLDPTLLLDKNNWNELVKGVEINETNYLCAYVVSPNDEYIKIVNMVAKEQNLKIIHFGLTNPGYIGKVETKYDLGPEYFVRYIKNANFVVTTSFHATVFSIIYNKQFLVVPHKETGSRVSSLLNLFDLSDCIIYNSNDVNKKVGKTNKWNTINEKLDYEREKSKKWLFDSIDSEVNK